METTSDGKFINMPASFTLDQASAIPNMGIHYCDKASAALAQDWFNPVLVMGSYASKVAFFEPMIPMDFFTGNSTSYDSGEIVYTQNTDSTLVSKGLFKSATLPTSYAASYDQGTATVTVVVKGVSNEGPCIFVSAAPAAASAVPISLLSAIV